MQKIHTISTGAQGEQKYLIDCIRVPKMFAGKPLKTKEIRKLIKDWNKFKKLIGR